MQAHFSSSTIFSMGFGTLSNLEIVPAVSARELGVTLNAKRGNGDDCQRLSVVPEIQCLLVPIIAAWESCLRRIRTLQSLLLDQLDRAEPSDTHSMRRK